jgi:tyrosyl-tRNA synthetase
MTTNFKPVAEQLAYLKKGVAEIIPEAEFQAKLEKSYKTGKPLRIKLGVDPTAPDIHLGHMVVIEKLHQFQILGHTAVFLIGDFTAMVGDPTGQSETRPPLTREQVQINAKTYLDQVFKILDPKKTEIRYNSEWLDKLSSYDIVRLCGKYRVARMLEREDFHKRLIDQQPISMHELLYPLLVAYDSVMLEADVELGATEQKFNLLIGRDIQREYGYSELQIAFMMPILVGLDGSRKMSKSLGNYVGITDLPNDMFGKLMSMPDDLMWSYFELLTPLPQQDVETFQRQIQAGQTNPRNVKITLAKWIVRNFHGHEASEAAATYFDRVFSQKQAPLEVPVKVLKCGPPTRVWSLIRIAEFAPSRSEAERLIKQGAIELNGSRVSDIAHVVDATKPGEFLLRAGKRKFMKFVFKP